MIDHMPSWNTYRSYNMGFLQTALSSLGGGAVAGASTTNKGREFLFGKPERMDQFSKLGPEQQALYQQLLSAGMGSGAGGAFGDSADYYRDLLSNDSETFNQMISPEMRRFNEQIIPDLAEQFAGMGSGALSSSGFRNAAVVAGTDLSERLSALRAQLRQQGAAGLAGIGAQGLQQYNENIFRPETQGFFGSMAQGVGQGMGRAGAAYFGGGF